MSSAGNSAGAVVIVGGTAGIGLELARHYVRQGRAVVVTGRDPGRAKEAAEGLGPHGSSFTFDLARPHEIGPALAGVGPVDYLVLSAIERDVNSCADYDVDRANYLATMKLVGYVEVVHALLPRIDRERGSVLIFGGGAKDKPYPGSTTVTIVNSGVVGMVSTLALELKPLRVNAIHPGIVGDSPYWAPKQEALQAVVANTPTGRLVQMRDVVQACTFLLENPSVNGVNLAVDGGRLLV